jgi:Tfp pilus assembly protein PilO
MRRADQIFIAVILLALVGVFVTDQFFIKKFRRQFVKLEKEFVITSNKLTTAKIVQDNINHVHDMVVQNMEFPGRDQKKERETQFYQYITGCMNNLKLKLVSLEQVEPVVKDRVTTHSYDLELEGDFFKFGELCSNFENSRRIITIESFEVWLIEEGQSDQQDARFQKIYVKMRINAFSIKAGAGPALALGT